ncbi:MAG: MG2 domain-containing protein, partial [Alphaproteobacteria bacterium]
MGLTGGPLVTARLGDDLGIVASNWTEGIDLFRFDLPYSFESAAGTRAHTVLARNLVRAGETAHAKHFLRSATGRGFGLLPPAERPTTAVLRHDGSGNEISIPLSWGPDGTATTDWAIPREAKLGLYRVVLRRPAAADRAAPGASPTPAPKPTPTPRWPYASLGDAEVPWQEWETGELRVEEFRVPLLETTLRLPSGPEVAPKRVTADLVSAFMAGGAARDLPVVVRSRVTEAWIEPPAAFSGFSFGGAPVVEGVERTAGGNAGLDSSESESGAEASAAQRGIFRRDEVRLDATGSARVEIADVPPVTRPSELQVEAELRDPNGESQTTTAKVRLWPSSRVVGIRAEADPRHRRRGTADLAVLDARMQPVAGARVDVDLFTQRHYTTRQRVVGGFYAYQNVIETRRAGSFCKGRTGADGRLRCAHSLPEGHDFVLRARTRDEAGRIATATSSIWLPGDDGDWSPQTDDDRMDVIPERKSWEPGETARLRAVVPFRAATTLVSVAREGVLDARVVTLGRGDGSFEVPILPSYSPNVFVHALAVRGRVGSIQPTATLDLGKPAFRLGIAPIDVGWKPHRLEVKVEPEREVYRPREEARVRIAVRSADGTELAPGSSVSVAAIDEGLLRLLPNDSWKLLEAMMAPRGDQVETASSLLQVIGKRHFGKKARPDGGGGGNKPTRELFDTLLLWRATLPLDRDGRAEVSVPLNDSLTAFRIAAIASAGTERFGTGEATIRSTQDLMVLSGLPPLVRSGDRFAAPFTVRNASDRPLDVVVRAAATGLATPELGERSMRLEPGESRIASWEVEVPVGIDGLAWNLEARAKAGTDGEAVASDRLSTRQRVVPSV